VAGILAAGDEYKDLGGPSSPEVSCIKDPKARLEDLQGAHAREDARQEKPTATAPEAAGAASYGEGARVRYQYGKLKAFRDLPSRAAAR
jgi:hypothetical protein